MKPHKIAYTGAGTMTYSAIDDDQGNGLRLKLAYSFIVTVVRRNSCQISAASSGFGFGAK
jgi:hypothetical protein